MSTPAISFSTVTSKISQNPEIQSPRNHETFRYIKASSSEYIKLDGQRNSGQFRAGYLKF